MKPSLRLVRRRSAKSALLGFGGDSTIELFSAIFVLWRFRSKPDSADAEKLAARVAGSLLFIVAAFVVASSGLSLLGYREPQPSFTGIILLIVAAIGMPWLAQSTGNSSVLRGETIKTSDSAC